LYKSLASLAVKMDVDVGRVKVIIVYSKLGGKARCVAKFRPGVPVAVLTPSPRVKRQCYSMLKRCYTYVVDMLKDTKKLNKEVINEYCIAGIARVGLGFILCGSGVVHANVGQKLLNCNILSNFF
jgi:pyruvate kinase